QDPVEMGLTLQQLVNIAQDQPYYPTLFRRSFGDDEVTTDRISKALAQFVRSIVSTNSKYDRGSRNVNSPLDHFSNFTKMENRGKELFMSTEATGTAITCVNCHMSESFVSPTLFSPGLTTSTQNIGLDRRSTDDFGVMETTGNPEDAGKFKAPSLRNIGVSAPYMHDGRFRNLRDVVKFYSRDIEPHPNLSALLQDERGNLVRFNFSREEEDALVAFLNTLTDRNIPMDEKFSDPFRPEKDNRRNDR
ncbi:MAG: cytochrome-c peroxidase, partial [Cyclobacteriaceae bacterium]|nr:cytochrome-c peroxidase [Cyclobacteriaceae bacterium]